MRKEEDITITEEGRDKGKVFHIREMPAVRAEKWAMKALLLALRHNPDIGNVMELKSMGMQGIAYIGVTALMRVDFTDAEPLLDEMMECVTVKPGDKAIYRPLLPEDDIEEVATLLYLRERIIEMHVGFSSGGEKSGSTSGAKTQAPSP